MAHAAHLLKTQRDFFSSGRGRALGDRLIALDALTRLVEENADSMYSALQQDLGKSPFESHATEVAFLKEEIAFTRQHLAEWIQPQRVPTPLLLWPARSEIRYEPLGQTLIIAPWNYPIQLLLAPLIGALAAGNTAILKPSELAPASENLMISLIPKYFSQEQVAVYSGGLEATQELLREKFDFIFFTGSTQVGKAIMLAAAEHLTPVCLELGGKCPTVIDANCDLELSARRIAWGKFTNAGQTCIAPDFLMVDQRVHDEFLALSRQATRSQWGEDPKASADYPRIINDRHFQRLRGYLNQGTILWGGEVDVSKRFIAPTVMTVSDFSSPVMQEEIFGPILPVLKYDKFSEMLSTLRGLPKPLAAYLFSKDQDHCERFTSEISAGGICLNDCLLQLGNPHLPFGGVGPSGMGSYHGRASLETFSHRKSVLHRRFELDMPFRYPPYTASKFRWLKRFMG